MYMCIHILVLWTKLFSCHETGPLKYTCTCRYTFLRVWVYTNMYVCIYIQVYIYMCVCITMQWSGEVEGLVSEPTSSEMKLLALPVTKQPRYNCLHSLVFTWQPHGVA